MNVCPKCGCENVVKAGLSWNKKQQIKCKQCKKISNILGDNRKKYTNKEQEMAFILYTEGNGFRRIARILSKIFNKKIYYQTVHKWLQSRHKVLSQVEEKSEEIEILEADELFTFVKKNHITSEFGLLLTETKCVLLYLK